MLTRTRAIARARVVAVATAAVLAATAGAATAGDDPSPKPYAPLLTDAAGDGSSPGLDVVDAGFTTTGTTTVSKKTTYTYKVVKKKVVKTVKGKKRTVIVKKRVKVAHRTTVKTYTPDAVIGRITMAGDAASAGGTSDEMDFTVNGCPGTAHLYWTPGAALVSPGFADFGACDPKATPTGSAYAFEINVRSDGHAVLFTIPMGKLPAQAQVGGRFASLTVETGTTDPLVGLQILVPSDDAAAPAGATYTIG